MDCIILFNLCVYIIILMYAYRFEIKNAKSTCLARLSISDVLLVMSFLSTGFILLLGSSYLLYGIHCCFGEGNCS